LLRYFLEILRLYWNLSWRKIRIL